MAVFPRLRSSKCFQTGNQPRQAICIQTCFACLLWIVWIWPCLQQSSCQHFFFSSSLTLYKWRGLVTPYWFFWLKLWLWWFHIQLLWITHHSPAHHFDLVDNLCVGLRAEAPYDLCVTGLKVAELECILRRCDTDSSSPPSLNHYKRE